MKRLPFFLVLVLVAIRLDAQQSLLIFFEATEKKPFYVKLGSKTTASSSTGQVYLTDLTEKNYDLLIGFPNEQIAEQQFAISLGRYDNSFQLKEVPGSGWTLINLETSKVINASAPSQPQFAALKGVRKTDAFSVMMAGVVNDTAVLYTSVVAPPAIAASGNSTSPPVAGAANPEPSVSKQGTSDDPETVAGKTGGAVKADSLVNTELVTNKPKTMVDSSNSAVAANDRAAAAPAAKLPDTLVSVVTGSDLASGVPKDSVAAPITKATNDSAVPVIVTPPAKSTISEKSETTVTPPVSAPQQNTIQVDSGLAVAGEQKVNKPVADLDRSASSSAPTAITPGNIVKLKEQKNDKGLVLSYADIIDGKADTINITIVGEAPAVPVAKKDSVKPKWSANPRPLTETSADTSKSGDAAKSSPVMINSDCVNFATEYDVDKLRVKMVSETTADDRILAARKVFRTKCFTSRQIRALTELFINDEGKYKFLDAAYPFVSDSEGFRKLVEVLNEDYYVKRFNAMIRL